VRVEAPRRAVTLDEVRAHRDSITRLGERFGVRNIRLFGLVARGEATSGSDLDLLAMYAGLRRYTRPDPGTGRAGRADPGGRLVAPLRRGHPRRLQHLRSIGGRGERPRGLCILPGAGLLRTATLDA